MENLNNILKRLETNESTPDVDKICELMKVTEILLPQKLIHLNPL